MVNTELVPWLVLYLSLFLQIKLEPGESEAQKSSKVEPPDISDEPHMPLEDILNEEKSEIERIPSPIGPEEPVLLKCTNCEQSFLTVSELR